MKRSLSAWTAMALVAAGCGEVPVIDELSPERTCRRTVIVGPLPGADAPTDTPAVEWRVPDADAVRSELDAWCAAVGRAVLGGFGEPAAEAVDSIAIVSWNVHVGGGDLGPLVADLRSGGLTRGAPVRHFVLLLQEAYRAGEVVPPFQPGLGGGSAVEGMPTEGPRRDIVAHADTLDLYLYYVPSMRSGEAREDRGNAILSTLPLRDPLAIELPVARQRRVAATATVSAMTAAGEPWALQVTSVHLENDARGWANDERARLIQGEALLDALPDADAAVAAGDFNTWGGAEGEAVIDLMRRAFEDTPPFPPGATYVRAFGILRKYLDYMFFRLPDEARGRYRRVQTPYNSDHYPLLGWVVFSPG